MSSVDDEVCRRVSKLFGDEYRRATSTPRSRIANGHTGDNSAGVTGEYHSNSIGSKICPIGQDFAVSYWSKASEPLLVRPVRNGATTGAAMPRMLKCSRE